MNAVETDFQAMELGISQILGYTPYEEVEAVEACAHWDDGNIYDESATTYTLRCNKCGEFYEQRK